MNRQVYPSSLFPLRGDVSAEAGATIVEVIGIEGFPISGPPTGPDTLIFNTTTNTWNPTQLNACVLCNGVPVSGDYAFFSRGIDLAFLTGWTHGFAYFVFQNGVGVPGTETSR
jgi:hypothetical protein